MLIIHIVVVLVVVGILLGLINRYIPMASSIKTILNLVVVFAVIFWILQVLGVLPAITQFWGKG